MSNRLYYIAQYRYLSYQHGGTSFVDIETILEREGYEPITLTGDTASGFRSKLERIRHFFYWVRKIKKGDTVIFIFPVFARLYRLLARTIYRRGARVIPFVADYDGIRDADAILEKAETIFLRQFAELIVQTPMAKIIAGKLPHASLIEFKCFDYLTSPPLTQRYPGNDVVFAGNLVKSKFLTRLQELDGNGVRFIIYGPGLPEGPADFANCVYRGIIDPYRLPEVIEGSFGLVWDGDSIDGLEGNEGFYGTLNTPHKLSLYILCGLPVIAHADSGSAPLLAMHNIGITVTSLREIPEKIKALPKESYELMRSNMKSLAAGMSEGNNMKEVLRKVHRKDETSA